MTVDFSKYGKPIAQSPAGAQPAAPAASAPSKYGRPVEPVVEPQQDGFFKSLAKGIVKPVATMVARPIQAIAALGGADTESIDAATKKIAGDWVAPTPKSGTDVLKDVGRGIETVALGVGGEGMTAGKTVFGRTIPKLLETPGVLDIAKEGAIKAGLKTGVTAGGIGGFGAGLEDKGTIGEALKQGGIGALTGGALGGTLAGAGKAFSAKMESNATKAATKAEEASKVASGAYDATVATKMPNETGQKTMFGMGKVKDIVNDPVAQEAVKQGIKEDAVALVKDASPEDSEKMLKMLDIRKRAKIDKRFGSLNRTTDVSGNTGMEIARHLETVNKEAGQKLNSVAKALAGRKVNPTKALTSFGEAMDGHGITIKKGGVLNFKGSDFEGVPSTQKLISNIWDRTMRAVKTGDAYQLHRLKTFIDENVSYGKQVEGLSGKAERLVKGLRKGIDTALDEKFPTYNKVNTQFSDTIGEMNKLADNLGIDFKMGKDFADMKLGSKLRGLLSHNQGRAQMLQTLESAQKVAKAYGYKGKEDIINLANFSDVLESMKGLGSEAPTSFLGQGERFANQAGDLASVGADALKGGTGLVSGGIKALKFISDTTRGINEENQIAALEALLKRNVAKKAPSNFGRSIK